MFRKIIFYAVIFNLVAHVCFSQSLQFENIHFSSTRGFNQASDNSIGFLYRERGLQDNYSEFIYATFNQNLEAHKSLIRLYRGNNALATVGNQQYSAHLFQRVNSDSIKVIFLNDTGRIISKKEFVSLSGSLKLKNIFSGSSDSTFNFVYQKSGAIGYYVIKQVNLNQDTIWSQKLATTNKLALYEIIQDKENLWFIGYNVGNKRSYTIFCLNHETGHIKSQNTLHKTSERIDLIETTIGPNRELVVLGRWFKKKIKSNKPGNFYMASFSPEGERSQEVITTQNAPNTLATLTNSKLMWQHMYWNPAGHWELVGETFKNTSLGSTIAIGSAVGIATMGMVRVNYAALTTKDLVHIQVAPNGELKKTSIYKLPSTRIVSSWSPAFDFAKIAKTYGYFRFRGILTNPYAIITNTKHTIQAFMPGEILPINLTENESKNKYEVLTILGNELIVSKTDAGNTMTLNKITLPANLSLPQTSLPASSK